MSDTVTIEAPSRLHFGLLNLPSADESSTRRFGSVGLMVRDPGLRLEVKPANKWSAEGPLSQRALGYAHRFTDAVCEQERCFHIAVERAPRQHVGLGTGTQLALAVGRALQSALQIESKNICDLAQQLGRGCRSALGIHGFAQGGFLIDGGKRNDADIAPLICRWDFPDDWRILLVIPHGAQGTHGTEERRAFAQMKPATDAETETLCRLVLLEMLPALRETDLPAFGEALYEFNRRVGERFRPFQNGVYASPRMAEMVAYFRSAGVHGVGQSSWGPTVFAIVEAGRFEDIREFLCGRFGLAENEVIVTRAANVGAVMEGAGEAF